MANPTSLHNALPKIWVVGHQHIRKARAIDYVGELHLELILRFGGVPIIVPRTKGITKALDSLGQMHGLLLVEGEDVAPHRYVLEDTENVAVQRPDLPRDEVEFELIERAMANEVPILGICRGCHVLNIASGGSLYADVKQDKGTDLDHLSLTPEAYDTYRHTIRIEARSPLARWFGKKETHVNSYHHQGVKALGTDLVSMASSEDGLVEAFYHPQKKFRVGLQFHPERMLDEEPLGAKIYDAFVQAAKKFQQSMS